MQSDFEVQPHIYAIIKISRTRRALELRRRNIQFTASIELLRVFFSLYPDKVYLQCIYADVENNVMCVCVCCVVCRIHSIIDSFEFRKIIDIVRCAR